MIYWYWLLCKIKVKEVIIFLRGEGRDVPWKEYKSLEGGFSSWPPPRWDLPSDQRNRQEHHQGSCLRLGNFQQQTQILRKGNILRNGLYFLPIFFIILFWTLRGFEPFDSLVHSSFLLGLVSSIEFFCKFLVGEEVTKNICVGFESILFRTFQWSCLKQRQSKSRWHQYQR